MNKFKKMRNYVDDCKNYIYNRWLSKTHIVSTGTKKGQYIDPQHALFNAAFNILVDFVEVELALKYDTKPNKWYEDWFWWLRRAKPDPVNGVKMLKWHIKESWDSRHPKNLLKCYLWYKNEWPKENPYDAKWLSLYDKVAEKPPGLGFVFGIRPDADPTDVKLYKKYSSLALYWDTRREKKETEMLIKLAEAHKWMWT